VNMRDNSSSSNCSLDKSVKFFISSDCKLEMSWCDSLDLEIFGCISSKFKYLCCKILKNCSCIDCCCCAYSLICRDSLLDKSMDSTHWELKTCSY